MGPLRTVYGALKLGLVIQVGQGRAGLRACPSVRSGIAVRRSAGDRVTELLPILPDNVTPFTSRPPSQVARQPKCQFAIPAQAVRRKDSPSESSGDLGRSSSATDTEGICIGTLEVVTSTRRWDLP